MEAKGTIAQRLKKLRKASEVGFMAAVPALAKAGERWAPGPAAALAAWAWTQLPPKQPFERRHRFSAPGGQFVATTVGDGRVTATRFGDPTAPIAWLMHGWGGWRQQMEPFVEPLLAAGYQVITHDALSHGDSGPGRRGHRSTSAPEMGATLGELAQQWGQPELVLAHSLGCQAAVWAHANHDVGYRKLVMVAPSASIADMTERFTAFVPMGPRVHDRFIRRIDRNLGHDPADFDLRLRAGEHEGIPVLLVHDEGDPESPVASSRALTDVWPDAELVTTTGLGHHRILRSNEAKQALRDWLRRHPLG